MVKIVVICFHLGKRPSQLRYCPVGALIAGLRDCSAANLFQKLKKENIMKLKIAKRIYWIGAALTALWFGASGIFELTKNPIVWDITLQLGYPAYFIYVLGVAKLLGIAVLLTPNRFLRLKEWVFAGIFFDIIFAFCSKLSVIGAAATVDAIVAFIMVSLTYAMFRKIYAASYSPAIAEPAN